MRIMLLRLALLLFTGIMPARAAITLGPVNRHVTAFTPGGVDTTPNSTGGPFVASAQSTFTFNNASHSAGADQNSNINLAALQLVGNGTGRLSGQPPFGPFSAESFFDVFITLDTAYTYALSGFLDEVADFGTPTASFIFSGPSPGNTSVNLSFTTNGSFSGFGTLDPGTYHVRALARMDDVLGAGGGDARFDFTLNLTTTRAAAVPEPASLTMFGLAALACSLSAYRRRKP